MTDQQDTGVVATTPVGCMDQQQLETHSTEAVPKRPRGPRFSAKQFEITAHYDGKDRPRAVFAAIKVRYPLKGYNATKILVMRKSALKKALIEHRLDPDFRFDSGMVAHFMPNSEGWGLAKQLVLVLNRKAWARQGLPIVNGRVQEQTN